MSAVQLLRDTIDPVTGQCDVGSSDAWARAVPAPAEEAEDMALEGPHEVLVHRLKEHMREHGKSQVMR